VSQLEIYKHRWQAEAIAKYLWWVATGLRHWQTDQTSQAAPTGPTEKQVVGSVDRPGFIEVRVVGLEQIGIAPHSVQLWKSDYAGLLKQTDQSIKDLWAEQINRKRWSALWYYDSRNRAVSRVPGAFEPLVDWTLYLSGKAKKLKTSSTPNTIGELLERLNGVS
jgi:hypothetical protein